MISMPSFPYSLSYVGEIHYKYLHVIHTRNLSFSKLDGGQAMLTFKG